ncbi:hypothetical protein PACTADRAFT_1981 [Pachysolen tannophilus NRRL Y-2460]|uniref:Copper-fist domain-containing protein n=1 Tax=Pachysolen tannophilus NRRL Y-2460 TaxID=669874 RepID=A0A1E4U099_PACTA|nr:hypothetical protein PACTADRAFT_1981 [Pachysolen tannophilus NRRL Y-2460]
MILVDGEKYACVQCIRGHRSSTCQHTKRPLVQVRSRGRPISDCNHRVTVFADQAEESQRKTEKLDTNNRNSGVQGYQKQNGMDSGNSNIGGCCAKLSLPVQKMDAKDELKDELIQVKQEQSETGCCSNQEGDKKADFCSSKSSSKDPTVIVLRASKRELYEVSKGSLNLLGPVNSGNRHSQGSKQNSDGSVHKVRHGPRCSCCVKSKIDFSASLNTLKFYNSKGSSLNGGSVKATTNSTDPNFSNVYNNSEELSIHDNKTNNINNINDHNKNDNFNESNNNRHKDNISEINGKGPAKLDNDWPSIQNQQGQTQLTFPTVPNAKTYDLYYANYCTLPGTCFCGDDCSCENCAVHSKDNNKNNTHMVSNNNNNNNNYNNYDNNNNNYNNNNSGITSQERNQDMMNSSSFLQLAGQVQMQPLFDNDFNNATAFQHQIPQHQRQQHHRDELFAVNAVNRDAQQSIQFAQHHQPPLQFHTSNFYPVSQPASQQQYFPSQTQNEFNNIPTVSAVPNNTNSYSINSKQELQFQQMTDCICAPEECRCYNCEKHGIVNGVRVSDGIKIVSSPSTNDGSSYENSPVSEEILQRQQRQQQLNMMSNVFFNNLPIEEVYEMMDDCSCPADSCSCPNCFKHGIINNEVVNFNMPPLQYLNSRSNRNANSDT